MITKQTLFGLAAMLVLPAAATAAEVFIETMGTVGGTTTIAAHNTNNGWDNSATLTYSGNADVRATAISSGYTGASGGANVFFGTAGGNPERTFEIAGINTTGKPNQELWIGLKMDSALGSFSTFNVAISTDGVTYTPLTYTAPTGTAWNLVHVSGTIPEVSNLRIKFTRDAGGEGFRVDDVYLGDAGGPPPPVENIGTVADVKAAANSSVWQITGVVTTVGGSTNRLQFTVEDATGGLVVDKANSTYTQPSVGDNVTVAGLKGVNFGVVQLGIEDPNDIVINSSGNPLPAPVVFNSIADALAADITDFAGSRVRVNNVYLTNDTPTVSGGAVAGTTTWLETGSTSGGINYTISDSLTPDSSNSTTLRITSDVNDKLATWIGKTRPTMGDSGDRFDVIGVGGLFNNIPQFYVNDPAGTTAKTDADGPIAPATLPSSVGDWTLFN